MRYRGIFINNESPALNSWVGNLCFAVWISLNGCLNEMIKVAIEPTFLVEAPPRGGVVTFSSDDRRVKE